MISTKRDEAWQAAADAEALGESHAGEVAQGSEPEWDAELSFYEALGDAATRPAAPAGPELDARLIEAALAEAEPQAARVISGRFIWSAVAVAVAAAVALVVAWPRGVFESTQGVWIDETGAAFAAGDTVPPEVWLVASEDACVSLGERVLCAEAGSRLRLQARTPAAELAMGAVWIESGHWSVLGGDDGRSMSSGDTFRFSGQRLATGRRGLPVRGASIPDDVGPIPVPAVERGLAVEPQHKPQSERPDPPVSPQRGTPRATTDDAGTLLARARTQLGEGKRRAADKTYAELLRAYPKSSEASIARVALGQLRLGRGRARSALGLFNAYLRGKGPLAEEAAWGRIQALKALGKDDALHAAVADFLTDHPRSVYRKRAQQSVAP